VETSCRRRIITKFFKKNFSRDPALEKQARYQGGPKRGVTAREGGRG